MDVLGDSDLIRQSLDVSESFGAIFDRYSTTVFRYVRRRLGEDVAADVTAEVFTRAFSTRSRFRAEDDSALPWLLGIATNLVRMHKRTEERRLRAYSRLAGQMSLGSWGFDVDARLDAQAGRAALVDALISLSARQRDVLLLSAWGDLDPTQIAVALDMKASTVRSDLHRARARVSTELALRAPHLVPDQDTI